MPLFILLAFLVLPIIEIASIIQVSRWIGLFPTLLLIIAFFFLGLLLIRNQSILLGGRMVEAMRKGIPPEKPLLDSGVTSLAGILFMIPGFITDILALLLLIPIGRHFIWRSISARNRMRTWEVRQKKPPNPSSQEDVIDAEYTEVRSETKDKPGTDKSPWNNPR